MGVIFHQQQAPEAPPTAEARLLSFTGQALCLLKALSAIAEAENHSIVLEGPQVALALKQFIVNALSVYPDGNSAFDEVFAIAEQLGYELNEVLFTEVIQ